MRFACLALLLLGVIADHGRAHADDRAEKPALHWARGPGAESCVSPVQLAMQVEEWLGPLFVPPAQADLSVEGSVSAQSGGFHAHITVSTRAGRVLGERELGVPGPSCEPLKLQAAFVIAVTLDPEATLAALPPELEAELAAIGDPGELLQKELDAQPPVPVPVEMARELPPDPAPLPKPKPRPPTPPMRRARFGAGFAIGALPAASATVSGAALFARRYLGFELALLAALPTRNDVTVLPGEPGRTARFWSTRVRAALCSRPWGERLWIAGCASASLVLYGGRGVSFGNNERALAPGVSEGGHLLAGLLLKRRFHLVLDSELVRNHASMLWYQEPSGARRKTAATHRLSFATGISLGIDF